jgi:transposase
MNDTGKKVLSKNISNKPIDLKGFFETVPTPFELAVESTYNWYFFVDIAEQYAKKVYLSNSYELKAFAKRHKKTDKIDAHLIADVLRKGFLPIVTIPDKETRQLRELLRYRMNLVHDRSRNIARFKCLLDKMGETSTGNFITAKRLDAIPYSQFPAEYRLISSGYIEHIKFLAAHINKTTKDIKDSAGKNPDIINLITIPGLDYFSASLVKTEIIDINRFASFDRLCAYAGLAPRVAQSAHKTMHGPLSMNRRKYLQWILLEVVMHFIKALPDKKQKYTALAKKKGANTAKVILARDMLKVIYHILKEQRAFRYNPSDLYREAA